MKLVLRLIGFLLGLLGYKKTNDTDPMRELGRTEQALNTEKQNDASISNAIAASRSAAARAVTNPSGLREPDRYSRD